MARSSVKFRDSVATYESLSAEASRGQFAPLYLLMGEESYFIDALSRQLSSSILPPEQQAFNQLTLYGRDTDAGQVINLCRQVPMMGSCAVIVLREAQQMRGIEKLALYTAKPSPTTVLVICHKEKTVDKRSQLYKTCLAGGRVLESVRPRDYEIGSWLERHVATKGCTIDRKALMMLTDHLGTDLSKIANELTKLLVSLPEGTRRIADEDIERHIGISKEYNNFELCRAVARQDTARALHIAAHFARNPKEHPLLVTILALFSQFRELFLLNYLRWQSRRTGGQLPGDTELMRLLRLNNPYALADLKQAAASWDNRRVFAVLGLLREYDAKSKGLGAGAASDGELLRELLLKILTP